MVFKVKTAKWVEKASLTCSFPKATKISENQRQLSVLLLSTKTGPPKHIRQTNGSIQFDVNFVYGVRYGSRLLLSLSLFAYGHLIIPATLGEKTIFLR